MFESDKYQFTSDWFSRAIPDWERLLADYKGKPNLRFLEIGTFEGRSAIWLLENILTHESSGIDCIDTFTHTENQEQIFDRNISTGGFQDKVKKIKGCASIRLRALLFDAYDFIYVDGLHYAPNVLEDAVLGFRLLKPGGIMVFDDYKRKFYSEKFREFNPKVAEEFKEFNPKMAIDAFLQIYEKHCELLLKDYQVALRKISMQGKVRF